MDDREALRVVGYDRNGVIKSHQKFLAESWPFSFVPSVGSFDFSCGLGTGDDRKIHACSRICLST